MEVIQFSHANGFPAPTYKQLFSVLSKQYQIQYVTSIGHDPRFPVTEGWPALVEELIAAIENSGKKPVFGVGHSLGGALTFYAALQRPDLFKGIVLLDPPFMAPWRSTLFSMVKKAGLHQFVTPGPRTLKRRRHFASVKDALEHFKKKPLFQSFDPACLLDYVEEGTIESAEGRTLLFDAAQEAAIYATMPHDHRTWKKKLYVPGYFMYGKNSTIVASADVKSISLNTKLQIVAIEGGHLFPFEKPKETASRVLEALAALGTNT